MPKREALSLTKTQKNNVFGCRVGYGIAAYKNAENSIVSFEFFIDRQGRMCFIGNGKPVTFDVAYDADGDEITADMIPNDAPDPDELDDWGDGVYHSAETSSSNIPKADGWDEVNKAADETFIGQQLLKLANEKR